MNLLEYAIQMEKDGEAFYRNLAQDCAEDEGMRYIFTMLADDEAKHREIFETMLHNNAAKMTDSRIIGVSVNLFRQMQNDGSPFHCSLQQKELYEQAYDLERKSYEFYMEKLSEAASEDEREIIARIAKEEKRHAVVLENIIEMVTRPDHWVENAEFNHMEQY